MCWIQDTFLHCTLRILGIANQAVCFNSNYCYYIYKACRQHGLSGAMKEGEYYQQRIVTPWDAQCPLKCDTAKSGSPGRRWWTRVGIPEKAFSIFRVDCLLVVGCGLYTCNKNLTTEQTHTINGRWRYDTSSIYNWRDEFQDLSGPPQIYYSDYNHVYVYEKSFLHIISRSFQCKEKQKFMQTVIIVHCLVAWSHTY